jgi:hypothetical protein
MIQLFTFESDMYIIEYYVVTECSFYYRLNDDFYQHNRLFGFNLPKNRFNF